MANDNNKKSALKSTAEVVATTSTILVAGKTIATVVDSTATSVKDMYAEMKTATSASDIEKQEAAEGVLISEKKDENIPETTKVSETTEKVSETVRQYTPKPVETTETVSEQVEENTETTSDHDVASAEPLDEEPEIISTEPLDDEQQIAFEDEQPETIIDGGQLPDDDMSNILAESETGDIPESEELIGYFPELQEVGCLTDVQNANMEDFTIDMSNFDNEESMTPNPTDDIA